MRRMRFALCRRLTARQVLLPLFPPVPTSAYDPGTPVGSAYNQTKGDSSVRSGVYGASKAAIPSAATIGAAVFNGSRVVIHTHLASEPNLPLL